MVRYRNYVEETKIFILLSTKEPPTEFKIRSPFKVLWIKLTEQHRYETCQKAMLPIKLKKKNTEGNCCSDGNEPEAKEPKVIY